MDERFCRIGDVELCYESFGDAADPPVLLIMGLGTQMLGWRADFCAQLAARGFRVVRFDNRDIGRSSRVDGPLPRPVDLLRRRIEQPPYTLGDMAADAAGLLEHLGHESAHVVGASMGGMIAQTLAARHPHRVRTLTSIMSTTGARRVGQPHWRTYPIFLRPVPAEKAAYVTRTVQLYEALGTPGAHRDPAELRELLSLAYERGHDPDGVVRQLAAIVAAGDRTAEVRTIRCPTLVIHGTLDRMVSPSGGRATAAAIPGARLELVEGMAHDLPRPVWPQIITWIEELALDADEHRRPDAEAALA